MALLLDDLLDVARITQDKLNIKIVCEEKRGLFGMQGAKTAKIKVTVK